MWPGAAAQMFGHLPGFFQQLLGITHHLRVSTQHHVAGIGVHRQANGLFQGAGVDKKRNPSGQRTGGGFTAHDGLNPQLSAIALF
ncbi:Uncharacterised protein [Raoultella planticola]|uniref:Uncharacterized protein n=1 Tax=Raoultella planticola TaxID=575 RepID=A0A485BDE8_RAOPL|nr:Uncharacterised protein [Raoultella planticola]